MDIFKVVWSAAGGEVNYTEVDWTRDETKVTEAITRLTKGPGRFIVEDVKVVNGLDELLWHWRMGKIQF
jgi:hypothetical protein|tara:strand:- start:145 stop:351 length:207 start_codon:yes stop_codon:yes gene_type:complete